tara:strand:+ start:157 stop:726 length:570 start_codon:yes stop_codon:yes gene_type:complete
MESAAELFSARGFAATSVRAVAARAEITTAGLYYHIATKEDLLFRTCESAIGEILAGARRAVSEAADPVAQLRGVLENHFSSFQRQPHKLVLLNREVHHLSRSPRQAIAALEREYLELVRGVIQRGQMAGIFKPLDPNLVAFSLLAVLNGLEGWYDPAGPVSRQHLLAQIGEITLAGILKQRNPEDADG